MKYFINPQHMASMHATPIAVCDEHLKIATLLQLRVIIYFSRHQTEGVTPLDAAEFLGADIEEIEDALLFWVQRGVLCTDTPIAAAPPEKAVIKPVSRSEKPSRTDVAKRGLEDENIMHLLRDAQLKFGRNLKDNETRSLVWLYEDLGFPIPVILMLIQYAVSKEKCNIRFIEKTAESWLKDGVESISDVERRIAEEARLELAWSVVNKNFGLERKKPSAKEQTYADLWINTWGYTPEMLKAAYDICIDATSKFSMPYVAAVIEDWHKSGVKTVEDIAGYDEKRKEEKAKETEELSRKHGYAGYDLNDLEKIINS